MLWEGEDETHAILIMNIQGKSSRRGYKRALVKKNHQKIYHEDMKKSWTMA